VESGIHHRRLFGLILLFARMSLREPPIFSKIQADSKLQRGSIKMLFSNRKRVFRLLRCVLAAAPLWFVFGIMVSFAPEVCAAGGAKAAAVSVGAIALAVQLVKPLERLAGEL